MHIVESEECLGCGICVASCQNGAIRVEDDEAVIDQEICVECGACLEVCPAGAIQSQ